MIEFENYLTVNQLALKCKRNRRTIERWMHEGLFGEKLGYKKLGKAYMINPETFRNWCWKVQQKGDNKGG